MKLFFLAAIRFYQSLNIFPGYCRFMPTCSEYMYQSVEKYGSMKGFWIGMKRIMRCHPGSQGGYDPVP